MKNVSTIIGLPVITREAGERIEKVRDVIYNHSSNTLQGLLVDEGGWFSKAKVIPFEQVMSIGHDAVVVENESAIITADLDEYITDAIRADQIVMGKKVMTEDGKDLGRIADVHVDEVSGQVQGYMVSGGMFSDVYKGQTMVPAPSALTIGSDVVFVPSDTVQLVESQIGGMKGQAIAAKDKVGEYTESAKESARTAGQGIKEGYDRTKGQATETYEETKERLKSEETQGRFMEARDTTKEGLAAVTEKANQLWHQAKESVTDFKDQADTRIEEGRIRNALGRPVNRVIFDRNDQVILNTGDLITNEAIGRARDEGVLDVLLSSVYDKEPELSNEELKAGARPRV